MEPEKIDRTSVIANLTFMAHLLTAEELLELRKIITKELSKRAEMYDGEKIYTKADVAIMFKELKTEIEEMKMQSLTIKEIWNNAIDVCSDRVQQKIDKLKETIAFTTGVPKSILDTMQTESEGKE